jgi:hypothetical protein
MKFNNYVYDINNDSENDSDVDDSDDDNGDNDDSVVVDDDDNVHDYSNVSIKSIIQTYLTHVVIFSAMSISCNLIGLCFLEELCDFLQFLRTHRFSCPV